MINESEPKFEKEIPSRTKEQLLEELEGLISAHSVGAIEDKNLESQVDDTFGKGEINKAWLLKDLKAGKFRKGEIDRMDLEKMYIKAEPPTPEPERPPIAKPRPPKEEEEPGMKIEKETEERDKRRGMIFRNATNRLYTLPPSFNKDELKELIRKAGERLELDDEDMETIKGWLENAQYIITDPDQEGNFKLGQRGVERVERDNERFETGQKIFLELREGEALTQEEFKRRFIARATNRAPGDVSDEELREKTGVAGIAFQIWMRLKPKIGEGMIRPVGEGRFTPATKLKDWGREREREKVAQKRREKLGLGKGGEFLVETFREAEKEIAGEEKEIQEIFNASVDKLYTLPKESVAEEQLKNTVANAVGAELKDEDFKRVRGLLISEGYVSRQADGIFSLAEKGMRRVENFGIAKEIILELGEKGITDYEFKKRFIAKKTGREIEEVPIDEVRQKTGLPLIAFQALQHLEREGFVELVARNKYEVINLEKLKFLEVPALEIEEVKPPVPKVEEEKPKVPPEVLAEEKPIPTPPIAPEEEAARVEVEKVEVPPKVEKVEEVPVKERPVFLAEGVVRDFYGIERKNLSIKIRDKYGLSRLREALEQLKAMQRGEFEELFSDEFYQDAGLKSREERNEFISKTIRSLGAIIQDLEKRERVKPLDDVKKLIKEIEDARTELTVNGTRKIIGIYKQLSPEDQRSIKARVAKLIMNSLPKK